MPIARRGTGRDYSSRPPQPHPDASARTPRPGQPPLPSGLFGAQDDAGAPTSYSVPRRTQIPGGAAVQWARRVDRVVQNAHNIRMFAGDYLEIRDGQSAVRPGTVCLICIKARGGTERVHVYVYLPDDIWYQTNTPPLVRQPGWHRIMRNYLDGWTVLSRAQRVVRACTEAQLAIHDDMAALDAADVLQRDAYVGALAHFQEIASAATGDIVTLTTDTIRRSFRSWADRVASSTGTNYDEVVTTLSDAIAEPTPHTGGDLHDTLKELAVWVPNRDLEHVGDAELDEILQVCENVQQAVRDERHTKGWQYAVLVRLGMRRRSATNASEDRSLTEILIGNHYETAVNYMDRFYDFRGTTPEDVERVLNEIANADTAKKAKKRHKLPRAENRLARFIRLRKKTEDA